MYGVRASGDNDNIFMSECTVALFVPLAVLQL